MKLYFLCGAALFFASPAFSQNRFPARTFVGGVSIAGLNRAEATRRLGRELAPRLERRITLAAKSKFVVRRRRDLGFELNLGAMLARAQNGGRVPLAFRVHRVKAQRALSRLQKPLSRAPRDARPILVSQRVRIRPEIVGQRLNVSTSAARLAILGTRFPNQMRFELEAFPTKPRVTRQNLRGINAVLASFSTSFNPARIGRTHNMRIAARAIDGTVLKNDAVFSLNQTVGPRTAERGYRKAIIFSQGRREPGLGGGVSQITGTLFNAALIAGLPIETYRTHSRPVAYLPLGRDATVAWGSFDMKFKNNTGAPIFISYRLRDSRLSATLFGKRTGKRGAMRVSIRRNGARDISAKLYRTIRQNGRVVVKEKIGTSRYLWKAENQE